MLKKIAILSILAIYVVSLFLPALNTFGIYGDNNNKMSLGYELLIYGATAVFFGIPAWIANITFFSNSILCLISSKHKSGK